MQVQGNCPTRKHHPTEGQLTSRSAQRLPESANINQEYLSGAASRDGQGRANTNQQDHRCCSIAGLHFPHRVQYDALLVGDQQ